MKKNPEKLIDTIIEISEEASSKIIDIYSKGYTLEKKEDTSPLTEADRFSHKIIENSLKKLSPNLPILSEEGSIKSWAERSNWNEYWLIDPLDGTKEFINRNGEFTVNIALIQNHRAVLGVVVVPTTNQCFYGCHNYGAFEKNTTSAPKKISVANPSESPIRVVGSRSHRGKSLDKYLERLGEHELVTMGSSLKLCLVASGAADIYPRLGPTSEWDTAASQAIVEAAGGFVVTKDKQPLLYNTKADILNPEFLVYGDPNKDWTEFLSDKA
ncbi:MAG: 3'(2'),5'-bisphosphate nucleotidase CysQ [Pseudomonadota bacterium]|nr:3'(2'),5'-bisphosphate nucleotidase CysQ [Pseudomonadota bacterium]